MIYANISKSIGYKYMNVPNFSSDSDPLFTVNVLNFGFQLVNSTKNINDNFDNCDIVNLMNGCNVAIDMNE